MTGRHAEQPPPGWGLVPEQGGGDKMTVLLHLEDAPQFLFDLAPMAGPVMLRRQIAAGVAAHCAQTSGWRRFESVARGRKGVSAFLKWIDQWNDERPAEAVMDLSDLTPFHIRTFRQALAEKISEHTHRRLSEHTRHEYYKSLRPVLAASPGTPQSTRRELRKRIGVVAGHQSVERYSRQEFAAIKSAARRVLQQAHSRISSAHQEALRHDRGIASEVARAKALHEVLTMGRPQSIEGYKVLGALHVKGAPSLSAARHWLFLTTDELLAAAVVIACRRGLNLSPITHSRTPHLHDQGLVQLDLDKPRRGPTARQWPEIITDETKIVDGQPSDPHASLIMRIVEATEPARNYLRQAGQPTDRLLIRWTPRAPRPSLGLAVSRKASWMPPGTVMNFRRLRRSVPGAGVAKEPADHSTTTYLQYVRADPVALQDQQVAASQGVQDAMDRARTEVHVSLANNAERPLKNDALILSCADPARNPSTKLPCTTGFFSFLDCLDCDNAATVARLLPAQLATLQVLGELRGVLTTTWERRFARRFYQLHAVVQRHSAQEREVAARTVDDHIPRILAALRQEVPR